MVSDATTPDETGGEPGEFTHLDERGQARMVDVGAKPVSERSATARARVELGAELRARFLGGRLGKGDGPAVARIAGISAAKDTARLIPLCHAIQLSSVAVEIGPGTEVDIVEIVATARARGVTGVEMEALTAVTVGLLTIYDMCKAVDRGMRIVDVGLIEKAGGKSGHWLAPER